MRVGAAVVAALACGLLAGRGALLAAPPGIPEDHLRWAWAVEKNEGQLTAMERARRGGAALPRDSAGPLLGQTQAFAGSLKARDPSLLRELLASLSRVGRLVRGGAPAAALEGAAGAAIRAHDRALGALVPPEERGGFLFQGALVARLAADSVDEYQEWLDSKEAADWFQAWGLVERARVYWRRIESRARGRSPAAAEEVAGRMRLLATVLASPVPPRAAPAVDPGELEEAATDIAAALSQAAGAPIVPRLAPAENVRIVAALLARARAAYRAGRPEVAVEQVYAASHDHYEEGRAAAPLRAVAAGLEGRITSGLRRLREEMLARARPAEIDGLIAQLLPVLAKAEEVLKPR